MDGELKQLEEELRGFSPSPLSNEVLTRMVQAMDRWEETDPKSDEVVERSIEVLEGGKVVAFPYEKERKASWKPMWGAAAAVAILGALIGVFLPERSDSPIVTLSDYGTVPSLRHASFVPVDANRRISSLDAGMISDREGIPYQVIRVVRQEEAKFRGADNVGLKISRPKVDIYVVPVSY